MQLNNIKSSSDFVKEIAQLVADKNIGFFDALQNGISLIEWPEIAKSFLKKNYLEIEIKIIGREEEEREIIYKLWR